MNLTTNYMGLLLRNPIIASASPLNADLDNIRALEDAGAGALVLPSIFAEQIEAEAARHEALASVGALCSPEATSYFPAASHYKVGPDAYLELVASAKTAVEIPIIASLNAASDDDWEDYATRIEKAGASALELNIYFVPANIGMTGREVEDRYLKIIRAVKSRVTIPIAVKISPYFSSPGHMATEMVAAGADGLVLFNRFYQPDIDVVRLAITNDLELSSSAEMRLPLMWMAILRGRVGASLAATTGVHSSDDVVKYLLAGADVVMTTSSLLRHGVTHMRTLVDGLEDWMEKREFETLARVCGLLSQAKIPDPAAYERANYIKILQGYGTHRL